MDSRSKKLTMYILIIVVSAIFVRTFRVTESPASVNWDEAALGYNAFSIFKTGRDEFGKPFPVSLRSFDDYKPAAYSYFSVVPIALFGLNEFSTRFTSIIFGSVLVFVVIYITTFLTKNSKLGIISGLFVAFSPWAIHFSRIAFESNVATSLYLVSIALFFKNPKKSLIFFILSMYTYHAQRAIALPTFFILVFLSKKKFEFKWIFTFLLLIPLVISFLIEPAGSRLSSTIIFKLWPFIPSEFPKSIVLSIYTFIWQILGQFMAYFSPINLFLKGSNEPILRIPTLGLLSWELFPLWLLGLINLYKNNNLRKYLLALLIITPLPGVITWNWFSVVRTLSLYPLFCIVSVWGYKYLSKFWKFVFWIMFGLSSLYSILTISIYAPFETYGEFQPGFEKLVPYVLNNSSKYNQIDIDTGQAAPYIFFLFYGQYPPSKYLEEARRDLKHTENHGYKFGKYNFRKIEDYELYRKDVMLVGQTFRLKDDEINHIKKDRNIIVKDFYDPGGYISLRVVQL